MPKLCLASTFTMMKFPPGLYALVQILPRLLLAPATVRATLQIYKTLLGESAPQWLRIPAYMLVLPAAFTVNVLYTRQIRDRRQAARRGAVVPPPVISSWPGALDKLSRLVWNFSNGYLGRLIHAFDAPEYLECECEDIGNTLDFYMLYESKIFTTEPEYIKAILATQFTSYAKGPIFRDQFNSLLGTGIFNSDGDVWKFHRTMTRPFFNKDRISDFDIFEKHAQDAIHQMKVRLREGYPVDFQDVASRFTLDSVTEFLFGKDVRSLSAGIVYPPSSPLFNDPTFLNHPANRFDRAFTESLIATASRAHYGTLWRFAEFWQDRVEKHMKVCYEFIDPIVADTLAKKHEQKQSGSDVNDGTGKVREGETLLEHLVHYTEDQTVLRDETLNIMGAGRDTTAATLTFAVYMFSQHPDVLARLREEILAKVGVSSRPTHDDIKDMKYLRAFINEVLRLYPPVPINVRLCTEAQTWPALNGGKSFYIPPNTMTLYSVFLMHRRKDLWGPDADSFDPDRFLDERLHKYLKPDPFIFLPFGVGPRICPGQQFAYHEASYFIICLLQSFDDFSLDMDTQHLPPADWAQAKGRKALEKVVMRAHVTMYVKGGLWVKMREVDPVDSI
ncbi:cytochrome P450 [Boletus coccyginus]|nr:cytochrome P450 [Boletus coccyginus]